MDYQTKIRMCWYTGWAKKWPLRFCYQQQQKKVNYSKTPTVVFKLSDWWSNNSFVEEFTASKSSTPTLVFSALMGPNGENRPTLKVIPAKLHRTEIARVPIICRPPRPSFFSILHFWPNLHISLCTCLLLYWVPLPQISAISRPIVTKFCGRNKDLFICNRPKNDRFREIFRGTSGPPKVNRFSSKVIFPEFLYFFP